MHPYDFLHLARIIYVLLLGPPEIFLQAYVVNCSLIVQPYGQITSLMLSQLYVSLTLPKGHVT